MKDEVSPAKIKAALGKKVEALAFNLSYVGLLKKVDLKEGIVRIEDKKDYVILEIERITSFRVLR